MPNIVLTAGRHGGRSGCQSGYSGSNMGNCASIADQAAAGMNVSGATGSVSACEAGRIKLQALTYARREKKRENPCRQRPRSSSDAQSTGPGTGDTRAEAPSLLGRGQRCGESRGALPGRHGEAGAPAPSRSPRDGGRRSAARAETARQHRRRRARGARAPACRRGRRAGSRFKPGPAEGQREVHGRRARHTPEHPPGRCGTGRGRSGALPRQGAATGAGLLTEKRGSTEQYQSGRRTHSPSREQARPKTTRPWRRQAR